MAETVIDLALTPDPGAHVTPRELLEDFADATPSWHFLEDESTHYAVEKGVTACVLRHQHDGDPSYVDFAFAAMDPDDAHHLELVLLDAPPPAEPLTLDERNAVLDAFVDAVRAYLDARPGHASLRIDTDDVDPSTLNAV